MTLLVWNQYMYRTFPIIKDLEDYLELERAMMNQKTMKFWAEEFLPIIDKAIETITSYRTDVDVYWVSRRLLFLSSRIYLLARFGKADNMTTTLIEQKALLLLSSTKQLIGELPLPARVSIGMPPPPGPPPPPQP